MKARAETPQECLGLALQEWRGVRNQAAVAELLGCGQSTYSRIERGEGSLDLLTAMRAGIPVAALAERVREIAVRDCVSLR